MAHHLLTDRDARATALGRQGGACAACGNGIPLRRAHAHHRVRRGDLGWCPCNVIALHPECHNVQPRSVHQRPQWAIERGLIVPSWADPRTIPVRTPFDPPRWLTCDGGYTHNPPDTNTSHEEYQ